MSINLLQEIPNMCCVCLEMGDFNVWEHKVNVFSDEDEDMEQLQVYVGEIFSIFTDYKEFLSTKLGCGSVCTKCMERLQKSYNLYQQLKINQQKLNLLYAEYSNQHDMENIQTEEEHYEEEAEYFSSCNENHEVLSNMSKETQQTNPINTKKAKEIIPHVILSKSRDQYRNRRAIYEAPKQNSSLIISQFMPATSLDISIPEQTEANEFGNEVCTMEYAALAVEASNINNLAEVRNFDGQKRDTIYVCKYCPQAFSSSQFLINHVRKNHVCKFCTASFEKSTDLFLHIRKEHQQHKCAICDKQLSSHSNLRAHIKRMHGVKLPPHVALLDYQVGNNTNEDKVIGTKKEIME